MNINRHTVKLLDADGRENLVGDIPDLWHIANDYGVRTGNEVLRERILEVWHMAHALKDAVTEDRDAKIVEIT